MPARRATTKPLHVPSFEDRPTAALRTGGVIDTPIPSLGHGPVTITFAGASSPIAPQDHDDPLDPYGAFRYRGVSRLAGRIRRGAYHRAGRWDRARLALGASRDGRRCPAAGNPRRFAWTVTGPDQNRNSAARHRNA